MSELEMREPGPGPMTLVEYQLVRMDGKLLVQFVAPMGEAIRWLPAPGLGILGACAGRYRIVPAGPWIVRAYYPQGFPGPQGAWPQDSELASGRAMLTG